MLEKIGKGGEHVRRWFEVVQAHALGSLGIQHPHRVEGLFNPITPTRFSGGRFDSPDGSYAQLYARSDTIAAVAETLLRDRPPSGAFLLPRRRVEGKLLSRLSLLRELPVAIRHGGGLSAIRQTAELTSLIAGDYTTCRAWAVGLRADAPAACGFKWRPRHDNDRSPTSSSTTAAPPATSSRVARMS